MFIKIVESIYLFILILFVIPIISIKYNKSNYDKVNYDKVTLYFSFVIMAFVSTLIAALIFTDIRNISFWELFKLSFIIFAITQIMHDTANILYKVCEKKLFRN